MREGNLLRVVEVLCGGLPRTYCETLTRIPGSAHATADTAACLLGRDLWYPPLRTFRDYLERTGERPHLWTFAFGPSSAWDCGAWNALSLRARIVRARAGSLCVAVDRHVSAWSLDMDKRSFSAGLRELEERRACVFAGPSGTVRFEPVATDKDLHVDLSLIEIIAHWLWMLHHRDRISSDRIATGYEVQGYGEACSMCVERWGLRPREEEWVPPFHPGCRCFAQPRYTSG
jgi:hypothetical protein